MKIGIIGAGTVGTTLGEHFAAAGHEVLITNSRGPESLSEKLAEMSQPLKPVTFTELVNQAEMILLALPWRNVRDVLRSDVDWRRRVVVDATNIILSISPDLEVDDLKATPAARSSRAWRHLPASLKPSIPFLSKQCSHRPQRASNVSCLSLATIQTPSRPWQI